MKLIAGLDEVGMGCVAGPLVVCVAAFPTTARKIPGVRDSKKCTELQRNRLIHTIIEEAGFLGIGFACAQRVSEKGIASSWQFAAKMALEGAPKFQALIVDGTRSVIQYHQKQQVMPKADALHWQVSAASIVAKVLRDRHMCRLDRSYPEYRWAKNSGYGTEEHNQAILAHGVTPFHRMHFLRNLLGDK